MSITKITLITRKTLITLRNKQNDPNSGYEKLYEQRKIDVGNFYASKDNLYDLEGGRKGGREEGSIYVGN